jgi:enterochelin esterase family protein
MRVANPQGTAFAENQTGVTSVLEVRGPAGDFQTYNPKIAHGSTQTIFYWSTTLQAVRRSHVYTPPGYMNGSARYPVLYLNHGGGDSDDSWTSVGHANLILDNLIAAHQATPMIIVMPFGHTPAVPGANPITASIDNSVFGNDLFHDLIPYIDANYRTVNSSDGRAMAGLSMGGAHTLQFGLTHPETFHYVGIFSMGLGTSMISIPLAPYEEAHGAALRQSASRFKLVYFAMGRTDILRDTIEPTEQYFNRAGVHYIFHEAPGGHDWIDWRNTLADFAPRLFK